MEDLNQDQLISQEEDGLFDDYVADETQPSDEDEVVEEQAQQDNVVEQETQVDDTPKPFLRTRFNGEDKDLNEEEARAFAQKGMNYDKLYDRYNSEHGELERIAKMNGMNVDAFLQSLSNTQVQYEIKKEIQNLQTSNPDAPEALLKELAEKRVNERLGDMRATLEAKERAKADAQIEAVRRDIKTLKDLFPDVDEHNLPKRVFELVDQGYTLPIAYVKYNQEQNAFNKPAIEAKVKIDKQNEENKRKSLGSITNAGNQEADDFLNGFFSE